MGSHKIVAFQRAIIETSLETIQDAEDVEQIDKAAAIHVAEDKACSRAQAGGARIVLGAWIAVVAGIGVRRVHAQALLWITRVIGTRVAVVTVQQVSSANTVDAPVIRRAPHTVVAGFLIVGRDASTRGAELVRAWIAIVAIRGRAAPAFTGGACVAQRAEIAIVAWRGVGCVLAVSEEVAGVVGARIAVVAVEGFSDASPPRATVVHGASVEVVAEVLVVGELAGSPDAGVIGAWIVVIANDGGIMARAQEARVDCARISIITIHRSSETLPTGAGVVHGARIGVVACIGIGGKSAIAIDTPVVRAGVEVIALDEVKQTETDAARIVRARVAVVADDWIAGAGTAVARVVERTEVAVVAADRIVDVRAYWSIAEIVGAEVAVVTIRRRFAGQAVQTGSRISKGLNLGNCVGRMKPIDARD